MLREKGQMERSQSASDLKVNLEKVENDSRKSPTNQKCQKFRNPSPCFNQPLGNVVIGGLLSSAKTLVCFRWF